MYIVYVYATVSVNVDSGTKVVLSVQCRRQDFSLEGAALRRSEGRGAEGTEGWCAPSLPRKFLMILILKWHILMHISGIMTYLF